MKPIKVIRDIDIHKANGGIVAGAKPEGIRYDRKSFYATVLLSSEYPEWVETITFSCLAVKKNGRFGIFQQTQGVILRIENVSFFYDEFEFFKREFEIYQLESEIINYQLNKPTPEILKTVSYLRDLKENEKNPKAKKFYKRELVEYIHNLQRDKTFGELSWSYLRMLCRKEMWTEYETNPNVKGIFFDTLILEKEDERYSNKKGKRKWHR